MPGWLESFLISLFITIGDRLVAKGMLKAEEFAKTRAEIEKAREYQKIVDKPGGASREERRKAEDDMYS